MNGRHEAYRDRIRREIAILSDEALAFQAGVVVGGIDREEIEREIDRRRRLGLVRLDARRVSR